jgi:predicted PurR-regulated permease PerM
LNTTAKYLLSAAGLILLGFTLWYFSSLVAYIIVASVLSLIGSPLVDLLGRLRMGRFSLPSWLKALLTLAILWILFIGFFRVFIPIVANEAVELSGLDTDLFISRLEDPLNRLEEAYNKLQLNLHGSVSFDELIREKLGNVLNFAFITNVFGTIATMLGDIFIAVFSISFIAFFLLKDQGLLTEVLVVLVHQKHEDNLRRALKSVKHLLSRYFVGLFLQLTGILVLVTAGMSVVGLGFKRSLLIGLTAAILNIIPYLGPIIGTSLGILLGMAFNINLEFSELATLAGYMLVVFLIVQMIDNFIFQPFIFSSSVNAHPLEIFIVILMAGSMAGVTGMILAIPGYTILRVFAKEFFNRFRVVKKLTKKI